MTMLAADRAELRTWRHLHGLTQGQLGDLLGVRWLTVQRWEAGTRGIPSYLYLALRELERELAVTPEAD